MMSTHGIEAETPDSSASYVDHNEAFILFSGLFGDYFNSLGDDLSSPHARIALAWQKGSKWRHEYFADTFLAGCRADELREEQVNSYFSVSPRNRETRKETAIPRLLTLHLDVDRYNNSVEQKIRQEQPSALVWSGNGLHAYWFLDAPVPIKQKLLIRSLNRELVKQFDGDFNSTDVGHVLRVPGTFNVKNPDDPKRVELLECDAKTRYPLDYLIERFGSNLQSPPPEAAKVLPFEPTPRGRFLSSDERLYVERLLREGLFEQQSRNHSILLLGRYCLEQPMSRDEAKTFIIGFFENNHNGLSRDWIADREGCIRHIRAAVDDCWKKAPNWQQSYRMQRSKDANRKLSTSDLDYIYSRGLTERDQLFLTDAMTFILNYQRDGVIVLESRQIMRFRYCHSRNYKDRYRLLENLGIVRPKVKYKKAARLGAEFYVVYKFQENIAGDDLSLAA